MRHLPGEVLLTSPRVGWSHICVCRSPRIPHLTIAALQEERAVLFCSEDRAVICRQCDLMIHTANEFTAKHHR